MDERLGFLGTLAALAGCLGAAMLYWGDLTTKTLGALLLAPAAIFVVVRIGGARARREG